MHRFKCDSTSCQGGTYDLLSRRSQSCPTCGSALVHVYSYDRLFGPAPTGSLGDADNRKEQQQLAMRFRSETFKEDGRVPSIGFGRFDVSYRPATGELHVVVPMHLVFSDEKIGTGEPKWTAQEKADWKRDAQVSVAAVWNDRAEWQLVKPGWGGTISARPVFSVSFIEDVRQAYIDATLVKVPQPMRDQGVWDVGRNGLMQDQYDSGPYATTRAQLSNISVLFRRDRVSGDGHNIFAHEFGHMIGLPDEYNDECSRGSGPGWRQAGNVKLMDRFGCAHPPFGQHTDSVMSDGGRFFPRHFVTVWEALVDLTRSWAHAEEWVLIEPQ